MHEGQFCNSTLIKKKKGVTKGKCENQFHFYILYDRNLGFFSKNVYQKQTKFCVFYKRSSKFGWKLEKA